MKLVHVTLATALGRALERRLDEIKNGTVNVAGHDSGIWTGLSGSEG